MNDDKPLGLDDSDEFETHLKRVATESARLRLDWYATEALLERKDEND